MKFEVSDAERIRSIIHWNQALKDGSSYVEPGEFGAECIRRGTILSYLQDYLESSLFFLEDPLITLERIFPLWSWRFTANSRGVIPRLATEQFVFHVRSADLYVTASHNTFKGGSEKGLFWEKGSATDFPGPKKEFQVTWQGIEFSKYNCDVGFCDPFATNFVRILRAEEIEKAAAVEKLATTVKQE